MHTHEITLKIKTTDTLNKTLEWVLAAIEKNLGGEESVEIVNMNEVKNDETASPPV